MTVEEAKRAWEDADLVSRMCSDASRAVVWAERREVDRVIESFRLTRQTKAEAANLAAIAASEALKIYQQTKEES